MSKQTHIFCWLLLVLLLGCTSSEAPDPPSSTPVATSVPPSVASVRATTEGVTPSETLVSPTGTPTLIPLNTATSTLVADETIELSIQPVPSPLIAGQYITLAQLDRESAPNEYLYLADIIWEPEQQAIIYAIQEGIGYTEAKEWAWWHFDLFNRENLPLEAPQSLVSSETRAALNLCPLDEQDWTGPTRCGFINRLFESNVHDLLVFSPTAEEPYAEGELWIANLDGSDAQKLADFIPFYTHWSMDGQWLATGWAFPGLPGQAIHYLVARDGSSIETLQHITGIDSFYLNGLFPQFSPTKPELLIAGSEVYESRDENDYKLYILDLNTLESRLVTDRMGLFQWADNGQGIYVLDGAFYPPSTEPVPFDMRETNLYYIDLTQNPPQEYLIASGIPYYSNTGYGTWNWAYSPAFQAIAYVGYQDEIELGILFLELDEEN